MKRNKDFIFLVALLLVVILPFLFSKPKETKPFKLASDQFDSLQVEQLKNIK